MEMTTVRLPRQARDTLSVIAKNDGTSMTAVLTGLIAERARRQWWDEIGASYRRSQAGGEWAEELNERAALESSIVDGPEDEEPYPLDSDWLRDPVLMPRGSRHRSVENKLVSRRLVCSTPGFKSA